MFGLSIGRPKSPFENDELNTPPMVEPNNMGPLGATNTLEDLFPTREYRSHVFLIKQRNGAESIAGLRKVSLRKDGNIFGETITELKVYRRLMKHDGWKKYIAHMRDGKVLDHGRTVYIDFDYVPGMDLVQFSKKATRSEIYKILADVAAALKFCFEAGVTHGDIKGDNIWIDDAHSKGRLIDFGHATIDPRQIDQQDDLKAYAALCETLTGIVPAVDTDLYKRELPDIYRDMAAFWKGHKGGAISRKRRTMKQVKLPAKTAKRGNHNQ